MEFPTDEKNQPDHTDNPYMKEVEDDKEMVLIDSDKLKNSQGLMIQ